jgi:biotin-(acetyl-CoA carboxylase) ligase
MKRKVIKRLTMLSLVSMFSLCAAVASANAQLSTPIKAKIPFDFNVGDKKLPAGEYTFSRLSAVSDNKVMLVLGVGVGVLQSTYEAEVLTPKNKSTLVFHKYGDQYFLEQIWSGGEQAGSQVPESRSERTIERQLAQTQQSNMSGKVMKVETVDIVASLL